MKVKQSNIVLIGFSGSGKTTVARHLAKRLKMRLIDIDSEIEKEFGSDISSIFKKQGEKRCRQLEHKTIGRVFSTIGKPSVVSLGGGAFVSNKNRQVMQDSSTIVWLSCSVREIYRRLKADSGRPLLSTSAGKGDSSRSDMMKRIAALLSRRIATYSLADIKVSTTDRSSKAAVSEIISRLRRLNASH